MNQDQIPIYEALINHLNRHPQSFHVPGHKNGNFLPKWIDDRFKKFLAFDVTELNGLDDFHSPEGVIAQAADLLSGLYHSYKSFFLVNGSTVGNLAMIMGVCEEGDIVFVQRNCHKSILHALMIRNVTPVFLKPSIHEEWEVPVGVEPQALRDAYREFPQVKACIFTYPNYYGLTYNIEELIDICHEMGSYVLVDEAHGAHFRIGSPFPQSSMELGADVVVQSAHKTLPAMTMGSFLHIQNDGVPIKKIEFYLSSLQSSSPSYPIMASLDISRAYLAGMDRMDILYTLKMKQQLVDGLTKVQGVQILDNGAEQDPLKITVRVNGLSGYDVQKRLEGHGIDVELADPLQVLLIFPLLKSGDCYQINEIVEKWEMAMQGSKGITKLSGNNIEVGTSYQLLDMPFKETINREFSWCKLEEAVGRISAKMVIPYPPGIPLLLPGERIGIEQLTALKSYKNSGAHFQGEHRLKEGKIAVFDQL
ncbi:aminotransferase class I/II-fold pyridoxal phosphate-dependent enzyme [Falsibacillus albus]|uniref:Aminotransferase class I/II-fold pyridoxal phosphate-dependent enzyme n=1 Tax=Falsibacillus albus TaxID=2478915 RepID=A0A3L7JLU3_9BACI|nr:aminotransferase class I/II-fold pyridoxal phosphate-dependent enzyme [Falsibacillus albus]RLQ91706.1 aminotransferase class I/II-fold pyridoxal phosphate-dependent enzyme [Falsibacillus albus]